MRAAEAQAAEAQAATQATEAQAQAAEAHAKGVCVCTHGVVHERLYDKGVCVCTHGVVHEKFTTKVCQTIPQAGPSQIAVRGSVIELPMPLKKCFQLREDR